MRVVYSDETGIGDFDDDPLVVVAAVMLNLDEHWHEVVPKINAILSSAMPPERAAKYEIKGSKLYAKIRKGDKDAARLVAQLLAVPLNHMLPIFFGPVDREGHRRAFPKKSIQTLNHEAQTLAFYACAAGVETFVRNSFPKEAILWIADQCGAQRKLKEGVEFIRKVTSLNIDKLIAGESIAKAIEPEIVRIADTIYFGDSKDSRLLQLADLCAATISHQLQGDELGKAFYPIIQTQVMNYPRPFFADVP